MIIKFGGNHRRHHHHHHHHHHSSNFKNMLLLLEKVLLCFSGVSTLFLQRFSSVMRVSLSLSLFVCLSASP